MEARVKQLETITKRLMRRAGKAKVALLTPYPISSAIIGDDIQGTILRYMFPCDGKLTKGAVEFDAKPKKPVEVSIQTMGKDGGQGKSFVLDKKRLAFDIGIQAVAFDKLIVDISGEGLPEIKEVWVSFLWVPTVKDVEVRKFLIEEMEHELIESQVEETL